MMVVHFKSDLKKELGMLDKLKAKKGCVEVNSSPPNKTIEQQGFGFVDSRSQTTHQRKMQQMAFDSTHAKQQSFPHIENSKSVAQRANIRGDYHPASLRGRTYKKHVVPKNEMEAKAEALPGDSTFVPNESDITEVINDWDGNFDLEKNEESDRLDVVVPVENVWHFRKTGDFQRLAQSRGQAVEAVVSGKKTLCQVGVKKIQENLGRGISEAIMIEHFMYEG
jgi:hypothetical protein